MLKKAFIIFLSIFFLIPNVAYASTISISAASAVVLDAQTGIVLYNHNANDIRSMASTTKIMTCLLACESGMLNETVTVTQKMLEGVEGSAIYIAAGDKITLYDLVVGAMLASGNDAANAIAVYLAKSVDSFVVQMNEKASKIGMTNTVFVTPSGLDDGEHHSTAYDMALLACEALKNDEFANICSMKSANISINGKNQTVYNHNKLLSYDEKCIGVKTGFTEKAGRCLVSAFDYDGNKIIIVTLGDPNDWDDHQALLKYAKEQYNSIKGNDDFTIDVVGGTTNSVVCCGTYDLKSVGNVTTKAYYYPFIYAPAKAGDVIGFEKIYINEQLFMTVDITVKEDVKQWQTMA